MGGPAIMSVVRALWDGTWPVLAAQLACRVAGHLSRECFNDQVGGQRCMGRSKKQE